MSRNAPPLHPFLIAVLPLLLILQQNLVEIHPAQAWRSILLSSLLAGLVWGASFLLLRSALLSALYTSLAVVLFYAMGRFYTGNVHGIARGVVIELGLPGSAPRVLTTTGLVFIAGAAALYGLRRYTEGITTLLNILAFSTLTATLIVVGLREWKLRQPLDTRRTNEQLPPRSQADDQPPDIFIIVLDGYARGDVLRGLYGHDNAEFVNELDDLGFHTVSDARANYMQTSLSLASALNLDYVQDLLPREKTEAQDRAALLRLIQHSQFGSLLERAGYTDLAVASGYRPTDLRHASRYLHPTSPATNLFERLVIENSGIGLAGAVSKAPDSLAHPGYQLHRERTEFAFEVVTDPPQNHDRPSWTFVHILPPHPPFVFDAQGRHVQPDYPYVLLDGSAFPGDMDEYRRQYIEQLKFVNENVLTSVGSLVRDRGDDALILIHADHGPGSELTWESLASSNERERFGILLSYRLPGDDTGSLSGSPRTPVNLYRSVVNYLLDTQLGALPDRSYFSRWDQPYDFIEVPAHSLGGPGAAEYVRSRQTVP